MVAQNWDQPACIFGTLAAAAAAKYAFGAYTRWRKLHRFELVGAVTALNIHPVKSCRGFPVQKAFCSELGLTTDGVTDRHWMMTRADGSFVSMRVLPRMALISTSIHGNQLFLDAPGMPTLKLPSVPSINKSQVMNCRVWEFPVEGQDCGQEASEWVSKFLEQEGLRIMCSPSGLPKRDACLEKKPWGNPALATDQSVFSDFAAYLLMAEESLAVLNSKLAKPVTSVNFRPSIIMKGSKAFDEDTWQEIRIGDDVYMRILDPCARCSLPTVDPNTGVKDKGGEPLVTLKSFRCFPTYGVTPIFCVNGAIDVEGVVSVGDPIYALKK